MTACAEGRSTVTGTRRNRSQGEATLAVRIASAPTCQLGACVSTVSAQNSPMAVQPPSRWDSSNTLWARLRTGGAAQTTTSTASATRP